MKSGSVFFLLLFLSLSCSKEKYASKPQLSLKDMSSSIIPKGSGLQITIEFTDAEGDLTGPMGVEKISSTCDLASYIDTLKYTLPDFPSSNNQKGEILLTFSSLDLAPIECNALDTVEQAVFKFWVKDKGGNQSDTLTTPPITIQK